MMRLLVECLATRTGGGVQVAADIVSRLLCEMSFEVLAVCSPEVFERLDVTSIGKQIDRVEVRSANSISTVIRNAIYMETLQRRFRPDSCYTVFGPSYWLPKTRHVMGFAYGSLVLPPVSAKDYETGVTRPIDMSSRFDAIRRLLVRRANVLITETPFVAKALRTNLARTGQEIHVVQNACSLPLVDSAINPSTQNSVKSILVPAAYYPHKNLEIVPYVAVKLQERGIRTFRFDLTLDQTTPQWTKIASTAERLGVSTRVSTLGYLSAPELARAYGNASAVFLPTLIESSTAVYAEAFATRRPLVTSLRKFATELCGDAAIYCDSLDPLDCAEKISIAISDDKVRRVIVERGCAALARSYLSPADRFEKIKNILLQSPTAEKNSFIG